MADRLHHLVGDLVHLGTVVGDVVCGGGGMSKKDEALKLALEALEHMLEDAKQERLTVEYWNECVDAITALREALAEQALDKMAENAKELGLDYEHPTQHWRAYASDYERGVIDGMQKQMMSSVDKAVNAMAQRTWVGLTDEEVTKMPAWIYSPDQDGMTAEEGLETFARDIEAKLKEKNT